MQSRARAGHRWISRLDRYLIRHVSDLPGGNHDVFFRRLSAAANNGKLWMGAAAVDGSLSQAGHGVQPSTDSSPKAWHQGVTNVVFKTLLPRRRPLPEHLPVFRFVHPQPTSSSMPSGHSASAVAFAVGAGLVKPALGAALAPAAAGVAYSRVHTGAHWPSDVVFGSAIGAAAAMATRRWWPVRPPIPALTRTTAPAPKLPAGEGLSIVVNTLGGSFTAETADALRERIP